MHTSLTNLRSLIAQVPGRAKDGTLTNVPDLRSRELDDDDTGCDCGSGATVAAAVAALDGSVAPYFSRWRSCVMVRFRSCLASCSSLLRATRLVSWSANVLARRRSTARRSTTAYRSIDISIEHVNE